MFPLVVIGWGSVRLLLTSLERWDVGVKVAGASTLGFSTHIRVIVIAPLIAIITVPGALVLNLPDLGLLVLRRVGRPMINVS
jgi:hypothetical protein